MRILFTPIILLFCNSVLCHETLMPGYEQNPGVQLFQTNEYEQAEQYFENQIKIGGEYTELSHAYLAKISILKNNGESAVKHIEKSLAIKPNKAQELMLAAEAYCTKAMQVSIFSALKLGRRCGKYYDLAASEQDPTPLALKSAILFHWEAPSLAGGSKKRAQHYLQQLKNIAEEDSRILLVLLKENEEGEQQAISLADHYASLSYSSFENIYDLAIYYRDKGLPQKAIAQFKKILSADPHKQKSWHYSDAVFQLGEQYIFTKTHRDEGIALIERYLTTSTDVYDPHFFWARWRLARSYQDTGHIERYEKLIEEIESYDYSHNEAFSKAFDTAAR